MSAAATKYAVLISSNVLEDLVNFLEPQGALHVNTTIRRRVEMLCRGLS